MRVEGRVEVAPMLGAGIAAGDPSARRAAKGLLTGPATAPEPAPPAAAAPSPPNPPPNGAAAADDDDDFDSPAPPNKVVGAKGKAGIIEPTGLGVAVKGDPPLFGCFDERPPTFFAGDEVDEVDNEVPEAGDGTMTIWMLFDDEDDDLMVCGGGEMSLSTDNIFLVS